MADKDAQVLSPGREDKCDESTLSPGMANRPRPAAINGHNRDVTEHTASLMSLFARPTSPPKTPVTPSGFGSSTYNSINLNMSGMPLMPGSPPNAHQDELDFQRMPLIVRATANQAENGQVYSSGRGSFISTDTSLRDTIRINNADRHCRDETMLVQNLSDKEKDTIADVFACTPTRGNKTSVVGNVSSLLDLVSDPNVGKDYSTFSQRNDSSRLPFLKSISEREDKDKQDDPSSYHFHADSNINCASKETRTSYFRQMKNYISNNACDSKQIKTTFMGALLYSLYSLVFCFAEASAITRPSHPNSEESGLLAPMAMMGAVSTLVAAPLIIAALGGDYPAPYPALDMFLAPFLAKMAADIDQVLVQLNDDSQTDMEVFLATFVALNAFGMALSAGLCILASKVKLANLASFLPYPVLCGFFSSVGISVWMSAFKVDTGMTVQKVLVSGETCIFKEFGRHLPSLAAGAALYNYGPKKISYLIGIISSTVILAYTVLVVTNHTLEEAQEMGFFWKSSEVVMSNESDDKKLMWGKLGPPSPLGLFFPSVLKSICWPAFMNGLNNVVAMSIIYLLRCSLHAAALRKNDMNIQEIMKKEQALHRGSETSESSNVFKSGNESPKHSQMSVLCVLNWYAYSLIALVFSGGFAVLPALSLGGIFARINAHQRLPQFTAMFILLAFYLSDFMLVSFVPKFTFSSLLVMAAIDLVNTWFVKSYNKTTQIYEWLVIPFIVSASLLSGMLQALGMGVCISTFIFVAQFYRSGVVKFVGLGLTIRSSIERSCEDSKWLDDNGDLIHILVLQNYLYFGNATSCRNYVGTMFLDDKNAPESEIDLPPVPKYVILDMSIVTGIDTSAVDVMSEISALCKAHSCCLLLSGIPPTVKPALIVSGLVPSRQNPHLFFMDDLDSSLGKAEDDLLKVIAQNEEKLIQDGKKQRHQRITSMIDNGLRYALRKIDEQHDLNFSHHLSELEKYAVPKELEPGELLNEGSDCLQRGLYFIESGLIKCSVDATASLTRGRRVGQIVELRRNDMSIGQMNARSGTLARNAAIIKNSPRNNILQFENTFRLGRFGPGWVIGTISEFTGQDIPGTYQCVTPCRVHVLSFEAIEELEIEKPALILNLYKMLAHLMARRQEMTIFQLSTFRSIMSSAPTKPPSRRSLIAVNKTLQGSV